MEEKKDDLAMELFNKAVGWYATDMLPDEAVRLYEESALLGHKGAENNYYMIIDAMSASQSFQPNSYGSYCKLLNYIKYFEKSTPNRLTNIVLMLITLNNNMMLKEIFEDNTIIKAKYKTTIEGHPDADFIQDCISNPRCV